jgi:hypothetical protein
MRPDQGAEPIGAGNLRGGGDRLQRIEVAGRAGAVRLAGLPEPRPPQYA